MPTMNQVMPSDATLRIVGVDESGPAYVRRDRWGLVERPMLPVTARFASGIDSGRPTGVTTTHQEHPPMNKARRSRDCSDAAGGYVARRLPKEVQERIADWTMKRYGNVAARFVLRELYPAITHTRGADACN